MLLKHPTRAQLITYAEAIVDGRGPIFSGIARHLAQCPQCSAEVEAICSSLRFVNSAPKIEPPRELELEILKRAREQKKKVELKPLPVKKHLRLAGVVCIAVWVILGYVLFGVSYHPDLYPMSVGPSQTSLQIASPHVPPKKEGVESKEKNVWHEIELLGSALSPVLRNGSTYISRQLKSVSIIDRELESAQTALRKNPNCPRANEILQKGIRQKAEILRQIYLERVL